MIISKYFLLFVFYSFLGWLMEVTQGYVRHKKFVNRGFLIGPYCPIYGYGAISMTLLLKGYANDPIVLFVMAIVICSILEYTTSFVMEKLFKIRWWDYSNRKFNINGRVCLNNAFFFGVLGTFLVYFANPFFEGLLLKINTNTLNIISLILMIIFTIDFIISMYASFKLKNSLSKIDKDSTEEIKEKIKEKIESKFLNRRIFKAYPKYKINIIKRLEEYRKEKIEKK